MQNILKDDKTTQACTTEEKLENPENPFAQKLSEVEKLVHDIKYMLVRSESALDEEQKAKNEVETLEHWMESYRRGLSAANKLANSGTDIITDIKNRLKLAIEERQRLESESPNTATKEQAAKTEELIKTLRRLEELIPSMEQTFKCSSETSEGKNSTNNNVTN